MSNYNHRKPLIQSAIVLAVFLLFILILGNTQPTGFFSGLGILIVSSFKAVLFIIGLTIGLLIAISCLFGIFFAAIAIYSPPLCSSLFEDLKTHLSSLCTDCCSLKSCGDGSSQSIPEEYVEEIENALSKAVTDKEALTASLKEAYLKLVTREEETKILEEKIETTEQSLNTLNDEFNILQETVDTQKAEIDQLSKENKESLATIDSLNKKIENLEEEADRAPEAGIFSYFDTEEAKDLFCEKIDAAIEQEMTYAQIDAFLTEELPKEVDKIVKDHPSLTKNYIRNKRR